MASKGFFSLPTLGEPVADRPGLPKCGQCGLLKTCISPKMEVSGSGKRSVLFVGEAPGEEEDRRGEPFVGKSGELLRSKLQDVGVPLRDCWVTNSIICRPPNNEIDDKYIDACRPALLATIEKLKPSVIVLLGASAAKTLIAQEWKRDWGSLSTWVGWRIPSSKYKAWLCPTYHPSFILRTGEDRTLVDIFRKHLAGAIEHDGDVLPDISTIANRVRCVFDSADAAKRLRVLGSATGTLAFDYETTGLKPEDGGKIISCSFCLGGKESWACQMTPELLPLLSVALKNKNTRKVASNLKFEERWTRKILGHGVAGWHWDTMLAAHVLDNRAGITSLKFQAYVRLGVVGYDGAFVASDHRPAEMDVRELLTYNAMDSLLEYLIAEQQQEEMQAC